jgi:predicted Ser/Thr protein kinase
MTTPLTPEFMALQSALAGEYSLERELGRGGMGIVYLARDVQLDRNVAIKVLPEHLAQRHDLRERFVREARTAAGLSHPHIVPIHRVGEAGGFVFFVMSYIAGTTLGERLRTRGPLPPADAMRTLREVAWALAYAHGRGVVHRDVKPDNILLEEGTGRALVTDFGIAQVSATAAIATDPGRIMGTAHFMSPEQAANEPVDGRSDLYALGVVGYLAVSGRLPFEAASVPALLLKQATQAPMSLGQVAPGAPPALVSAIERCLRREMTERFATGEALADALAPVTEGRGTLPAPLRAWLRSRNPALTAYAAWSGLFSMTTGIQLFSDLQRGGMHWKSLIVQAVLAVAPILPMIGYYRSQAGRLFRAGFSLADLRTALDVARREREEEAAIFDADAELSPARRTLRLGTYAATAIAISTISVAPIRLLSGDWRLAAIITAWVTSGVLALACNANEIPLLPGAVRRFFRVGLRERVWRSHFGAMVARGLGAPATSRPVGAGVFRATEAALGVAAADLYAMLPKENREQLRELPGLVQSLEARAGEARVRLEELDAIAARAGADDAELAGRRADAKGRLAESVAALEGIRLDLLRLHAGAADLAPLTTLLDAARHLGDDVSRIADAQRELRTLGDRRISTPV